MVRIDVMLYVFIVQLVFGSCLTMHAMELARKNVLHRAVKENDLYTVKKLLADGIDLESEGQNGCTPLFTAVRAGFADMISLLLAWGASPNAQTSKKYSFLSPFMYALVKSPSAIVALFFEKGVKIKPSERYMGYKPAKFARVMPKSYMLKCYGKNRIPEYDYSLRFAICSELEALEKVKLLIANGFSLNIYFLIDIDPPCNPIKYARKCGCQAIADYLLSVFEEMYRVKLKEREKRLSALEKLGKPSPKLFDKYNKRSDLLAGLAKITLKSKPDITIFFTMREKKQPAESNEYCLVQ